MIVTFEFPDSLFVESTIINGIKYSGDIITILTEPYSQEETWDYFYSLPLSSDISAFTNLKKLYEIQRSLEIAEKKGCKKILFFIFENSNKTKLLNVYFK